MVTVNLILRISQLTKKLNNHSSLKNSFEFKEKNEITGNFTNEIEKCARCAKRIVISDTEIGEVVCGHCGFVISDKIVNHGNEWRTFLDGTPDKARTGVGTSLAMHDMGLSTIIQRSDKDATGKPLPRSIKSTIQRIRKLDKRTQCHSAIDRNYRKAFTQLCTMQDKISVSDSIVENAAYIYRKAMDKNLVRGRTITALMASTLYAACRNAETPRTLKEIADATNLKKGSIADIYRVLVKELDLRIPVVDPAQCVAKIASKIKISEKTKRYAIKIIRKAQQEGISAGKDPMGIAAAALYLGCVKTGEFHSQEKLAIAANITTVTVRNRCNGLRDIKPNGKI